LQKSIDALIMAAGKGSRFRKKKQFLPFENGTVVSVSAGVFKKRKDINRVIIVYPPDMLKEHFVEKGILKENYTLVPGGKLRQDSVMRGLKASGADFVLIHDAARPACPGELIDRVISSLKKSRAVVPALKPVSTVKYKEGDSYRDLDREKVIYVQTPQGYDRAELLRAYKLKGNREYTDSSTVACEAGMQVKTVKGAAENIKLTYPQDYSYLKFLGREKKPKV